MKNLFALFESVKIKLWGAIYHLVGWIDGFKLNERWIFFAWRVVVEFKSLRGEVGSPWRVHGNGIQKLIKSLSRSIIRKLNITLSEFFLKTLSVKIQISSTCTSWSLFFPILDLFTLGYCFQYLDLIVSMWLRRFSDLFIMGMSKLKIFLFIHLHLVNIS